ncbi:MULTISPECIES: hypothetical protein [unclassified Polaromonas]|uniref:hypothetical protein n=1 Tax=unclassified Polaromonas TaxID=2638319 RepID=UPI0018CA1452|nr:MULTISPECIES: hypothetical protein [unclassified Polaromonas]MBG6070922.1 hypothetical protein [Polaromonas sp. CG_9.7]MBG6112768.1 hypothetical protein [Polaromonas sp. CG_9.2]MDH6186243.1 hypothetical protein [Polaromonas sp. CG_23.6]
MLTFRSKQALAHSVYAHDAIFSIASSIFGRAGCKSVPGVPEHSQRAENVGQLLYVMPADTPHGRRILRFTGDEFMGFPLEVTKTHVSSRPGAQALKQFTPETKRVMA